MQRWLEGHMRERERERERVREYRVGTIECD